jgi:hypothetical protein
MLPDEHFMRVTLYALENAWFRQAWEKAVRETADQAAAVIAGTRMAGTAGARVMISWEGVDLPVPPGFEPDLVRGAFERAVTAEVAHRIEAMTGPGAFG